MALPLSSAFIPETLITSLKTGLTAWLAGLIITTLLEGILLKQTFGYFRQYPRDSWYLKLWLALPFSLLARSALASQNSAFNIKAHGTGFRYAASTSSDDVGVSTSNDLSYTVDITLGGELFTVLLDTGSTDLWVNTAGRNLQLTNSTDLVTGIGYGAGQIEGNIDFAELKIGDFVIPSQAFLNPSSIQDFDTMTLDGIMGMAFDIASIYSTIQRTWGTDTANELGRAPITSLFAQNTSLPNNFDVQLGRTSELDDIAEGAFQISGHATGYEAVANAPQLPRVAPEHWSIVMDGMNINGEAFAFNKSRISGTPSGKIVAALDTGYSYPPLPPAAVDAIYGSIEGAEFDPVADHWIVPCMAATNLSFVFAGQEFPVHPLDLTRPMVVQLPLGLDSGLVNATVCINTYQYLTLDPNSFVGFDIILGDAFLRNVYASFDYGDYYPANHTNGLPFIQMLSTTDASTMWQEFTEERQATLASLPQIVDPATVIGFDTKEDKSGSKNTESLAVSGAVSSSDDSEGSGDSWGKKYGMIALGLLAANLLVGVVLLAVTLTMCVRGVKGKSGGRYTAVRLNDNTADYERGPMGKYSD